MTSNDLPARLRDALAAADFTNDGVADLLGTTAHAALTRNETVPGLGRTTGEGPLETLTRLFLLQAPVPLDSAERALPGLVDQLANEGILERSVGEVAARLGCRPYGDENTDLWVISDLMPGLDGAPNKVDSDHVLGISSASTSLAQLTIRDDVTRSLDLGTGCGVQALHLADHSEQVVATDVNQRALRITRLNAALNGFSNIDVRDGSFFEPLRGEKFDLIATNPPFVISPATGERLVYRDSGLPGDQAVEDIVRAAPEHLNPDGWCQILANWVITQGRDWDERLAEWVTDSDAWVVQREVLDPAAYVELWLRDAGLQDTPDYVRRYDTWLRWFAEQGIEAVGFGWINLRRTDATPTLRFEDWPYDVEQPIAPTVSEWGASVGRVVGLDDATLLTTRLQVRDDVQQETFGAPGAADPHTVVLRQQRGLRRARTADTMEAALLGACDGDLTVGQIIEALSELLEIGLDGARTTYLPVVREMFAEGFFAAEQDKERA